jgi:hypothetical protein
MKQRVHVLSGWPEAAVGPSHWRHSLADALRRTSAGLARLAEQLSHAHGRRRRLPPELEFYAEAGAPEGALYVDGRLVGTLPGVTRL